jgi:hypothetical protein
MGILPSSSGFSSHSISDDDSDEEQLKVFIDECADFIGPFDFEAEE